MCADVIQKPNSWSADIVAVWAGSVRWNGDVKMLRHLPLLSPLPPPLEVDGLSHIWPCPGVCYGAKVAGPQTNVHRYWCQFDLSSLSCLAESMNHHFLWPPRRGDGFPTFQHSGQHSEFGSALSNVSILVVFASTRTLALVRRSSH